MACFQGSSLEIQGLLAAEFTRNDYYSEVSVPRSYNPVTLCRDLRTVFESLTMLAPLASQGNQV
jgi:hypothetical protein